MGDLGIKISKKGVNVTEALDKELVMSSKFSALKVVKSGFLKLVCDGSGVAKDGIRHGLGYAPGHIAMVVGTASWTFMDASTHANAFIPHVGVPNYWTGSVLNHALDSYTTKDELIVEAVAAADNANKTILVKYLIFADPAQGISNVGSANKAFFGLNVSQEGYEVKEANQQQLAYSSKYKTIQYYPSHITNYNLTLPAMWASRIDTEVEEGTYVDFYHNLGYPPLFLFWYHTDNFIDPTTIQMGPFYMENAIDLIAWEIGGFCDATKVRISFWRKSMYAFEDVQDDYTHNETVNIRLFVFAEDLRRTYG